jgi:general secretion pathway protein G
MMTQEKTDINYIKELTCRAIIGASRKQGMPLRNTRGFTLIEVLAVCVILAVLTALAIPAYSKMKETARESGAMTEIRTIEYAIAGYVAENGRLPADLSLVKYDTLTDPWGNRYQYVPGAGTLEYISGTGVGNTDPLIPSYDLWSKGRDRSNGTTLSVEDNWNIIVRAENGSFLGPARKYGTP